MTIPTYMSGMLFTQAHKAVRSQIYGLLEKHDLNPTDWSVLSIIVQSDGGIRPARIAEILIVKPPLVTMISGDLTEKNLVSSIPHHTDKRAKLLIATNQGRKLAASVELELNREIASLMQGLNRDEISSFQKTLETIITNSSNSELI